ncbi:tripartite tricarboxylate transporter TctB family protein [Chenggangzhangella methanolivorans]|uniref:Tripartite tricarboxylate transporter TctB family protein n=1 Tax=Chenggangzhangella methanolivorans TaxID=1437009 RepID=A0A9E6UNJ0_9HYPH|nr:tripartite tricarboxylate transporter TctB family protein [Chenggangzhangella methanolivorans]QZO01156.1 tripartite tricarboxylate transporter TctB family protein [Chenggangzhangella methanolivorans]
MSLSADIEQPDDPGARGPSKRAVEIVVSLILIGLAAAVLYDSYGRGAGWNGGPESGFFPARVGWIFLAGSLFLLVQAFREPPAIFATWSQLLMVAKVFGPLALFVVLVEPLGIYAAAAIFTAVFMPIVGGARWYTVIATSVLVPLVCFVVFEIEFLVPLPKGPLEAMFGY